MQICLQNRPQSSPHFNGPMDLPDATALLWAQQLKREHKFLLEKINILEVRSLAEHDSANARDESRITALEQSLASAVEETRTESRKLREELGPVTSQLNTLRAEFTQSFNRAFSSQIQETGLPAQITQVHKKLDFLNAEIEDDSLVLTSAVAKVHNVQREARHLAERICSVEHWAAGLKAHIGEIAESGSFDAQRIDRAAQKLDSPVDANKGVARKVEEIEAAIADLRSRLPAIERTQPSPGVSSKVDKTSQEEFQSSFSHLTAEPRSRNHVLEVASGAHLTQEIGLEEHQNDSLLTCASPSIVRITMRPNNILHEDPQGSVRCSEPTEHNGMADQSARLPASNQAGREDISPTSTRKRSRARSGGSDGDVVTNTQPDGSEARRLRDIEPEFLVIDEKFSLPVSLPGRQTRSQTRAAVSWVQGQVFAERKPHRDRSNGRAKTLVTDTESGAQATKVSTQDSNSSHTPRNDPSGELVAGSQPMKEPKSHKVAGKSAIQLSLSSTPVPKRSGKSNPAKRARR